MIRQEIKREIQGISTQNPLDVLVCPITALSIYLSTFNIADFKDTALFPRDYQYKWFANSFKRFLRNIEMKERERFWYQSRGSWSS